jgi:hypothetical protein
VFLNLQSFHPLSIKIAVYAKLPYVRNDRNYYATSYTPHSNIHNAMHCITSVSFKTYFYNRHNVIYYHRVSAHSVELFTLDNASLTYKPIHFRKLNIKIKDESTVIIKTENGKWYVITVLEEYPSRVEYLLIINALSGMYLYKEKITGDNNIYVDILYPIANRVLPIVHFARHNVYIKLFDTKNEGFYTAMTISLEDIDKLVKLIINSAKNFQRIKDALLHYKIDYIEKVKITEFEYQYESSNKSPVYIKGARFKFNLTVKYKDGESSLKSYTCDLYHILLYVELDKVNVNCYLDFSKVSLIWDNRLLGEYNAANNKIKPVTRKYPLSDGFNDIYLSRCLYKDQCYYIYSTPNGVEIAKANKSYYASSSPKQAALYLHRNYLIMFIGTEYASLIIVDTKHKKIGYWICKNFQTYNRIHYRQYYSKLQDKLIFLSNDLEILFTINVERLNFIFNSNKYLYCAGDHDVYDDKEKQCDIMCYFNLRQLIAKTISHKGERALNPEEVKLIRHHVDTDSGTLYILASYIMNSINHIKIFSFRVSCNHFAVRDVHYMPISSFYRSIDYVTTSLFYSSLKHNIYKRLGMSKIFLYGYNENMLRSLDMAYNEEIQCLSDIRYNRNSIRIHKLKYISGQADHKDFVVVSYTESLTSHTKLSFIFIKAELSLVTRMTAMYV